MTSADRYRKLVVMSTRSTNGLVNITVTKNQEVTGRSRRKKKRKYLPFCKMGCFFRKMKCVNVNKWKEKSSKSCYCEDIRKKITMKYFLSLMSFEYL